MESSTSIRVDGATTVIRRRRQSALSTYGSYFGPYEVNDKESYEVTRQAGGINPAQAGQLAVRFLGFVGNNRFIEKPPPTILDGQLVQGYLTWERVTPPVRSTHSGLPASRSRRPS